MIARISARPGQSGRADGLGTVREVHRATWIWKFWVRSAWHRNQIKFPTRTFHTARAAGLKIYIIKFLKREYIIVSKNESHNFRALKIYNLMILILFNLIKAVLFFLFTKLWILKFVRRFHFNVEIIKFCPFISEYAPESFIIYWLVIKVQTLSEMRRFEINWLWFNISC